MQLALSLGKTEREIIEEIDSAELTRWQAYHRISPLEPDRSDIRNAYIIATILNSNPYKKKGKHYDIEEVRLRFGPKRVVRKPAQEILMKWKSFVKTHNANDKASKGKKHG